MIKNDSVPVFGSVHFYMNLPIISPLKFNMAHGAVFKIVLGRTFCFPTAFWASTSGSFRIVSDTMYTCFHFQPLLLFNGLE